MDKLKAFIMLDFKTVKPYFAFKNLILFALIALSLSYMNGTVEMSMGIGFMLGTMFISYPFALGEKSNLDALYTTLSVNRKTVVLGRYLFILLLNLICIAASFVISNFGVFLSKTSSPFDVTAMPLILAFSYIMVLIQAVQLPLYFKLSYTKAKFLSIIPLAVFVGCFSAIMSMVRQSDILSGFSISLTNMLNNKSNSNLIIICAVLLLAFAVFLSYKISVSIYKKREF